MSAADRMEAEAALLDEGYEPDEITVLAIAIRQMRHLIDRSVAFHLQAANKDRPDAAKYGTSPKGDPMHAPEWYMAQSIRTAFHEGLHGALARVLCCEVQGPNGEECIGSLAHLGVHWDGNGQNWSAASRGGEQDG